MTPFSRSTLYNELLYGFIVSLLIVETLMEFGIIGRLSIASVSDVSRTFFLFTEEPVCARIKIGTHTKKMTVTINRLFIIHIQRQGDKKCCTLIHCRIKPDLSADIDNN